MKYARTEDGKILEIGITTDYGYVIQPECELACHFVDDGDKREIVKIVKQADTIEELCDTFVEEFPIYKGNDVIGIDHQTRKFNKERNYFFDEFEYGGHSHKDFIDDEYGFYGAIWTNKGLIYVAKLNDKGDLELC